MDLLNKTAGQLAELLKSMSPAARVAAAVVTIAAIISASYLVNHQIAGSDEYLMAGEVFSPSQLRDMQAAFGQAGLEAHVDGGRVRVPRGQESKYMAALAEAHALPVDFGGYLNKALTSNSLMPTFRSQQDAALKAAKQQELRLIIEHMRGIEKAAVQIDQARSNDFPRDKETITAAVMVQPKGNQPLSDRTARTIRKMLASSVAGLKSESVVVFDLATHRSMPGGEADAAGGAIDDYADHKERQELDWQQKITHLLEYIPGVLVSTNVELEAVAPRGATPIASGSPPGDAPTTPTRALTVKRVHVSVAVPHNYYESVWHQEHPTPPGKRLYMPEAAELTEVAGREKKKIETLIANLLPGQGQVAVSTFLAPSSENRLTWNDVAAAWFEQNLAMLFVAGLVIVGLVTLHSTVKSFKTPPPPAVVDIAAPSVGYPSLAEDQAERPFERDRPERPARRATVPIHDELADIVRDDPDAAASILRTWIGNAS